MKNSIHITTLVICLLLFQNGFSQNSRPKIGVTLSGGGAKGLAHIGILEAIDSAGLKVDYITGTSMGSVVGGLYATGYSGDSIEAIARTLDWDVLFSAAPKLSSISIEEKDEYDKYAIEIPFRNGKFEIGRGIIEGQELWLKFAALFQPVYNVTDFKKLSIPFACIGTDVSTGNAVVMDHGNIIDCIRASMAIPSVFTPIQYEGKTLIDGGIVNNFPVLDVKKMGADYVIGVNLNKGLEKAENLTSMFDMLMQIAFYKDAMMYEKHRAACDIYILPELYDNSAGSFDNSDSIIAIGKQCGQLYYPIFKKLADSLNALYPPHQPFIKNRLPEQKKVRISKYVVHGLHHTTENFFFGLAGLNDTTQYSNKQVAEAIRRIYGSRYYKKIKFEFIPDGADKVEMHFKVEENPLTAFKFGMTYSTFNSLGLIVNLTSRDFLLKESRALITVALSQNPRIYAEYYKYIGTTRKFGFNLGLYRENQDYPVYSKFRLDENLRSSNSFYDLRWQYNITGSMYLALCQQYRTSSIKTKEAPDAIFHGTNNYWQTYLSYALNTLNKKYFATSGWSVDAKLGYAYSQDPESSYIVNDVETVSDSMQPLYDDYARIFFKADHFTPLNKKFTFIQHAALAYNISDSSFIANKFQVGGVSELMLNQVTFSGLAESEIVTSSIACLQLGIQYQLSKSMFITPKANVGIYNFHGTGMKNLSSNSNLLTGYELMLGYNSALGPIEFSVMYCDQDGRVRTNFNLGYKF